MGNLQINAQRLWDTLMETARFGDYVIYEPASG